MEMLLGKDTGVLQILLYFALGGLAWYTARLLKQIDGNQANLVKRLEVMEKDFWKLLTEHNLFCSKRDRSAPTHHE